MSKKVLEHKRLDAPRGSGDICFWEFARPPDIGKGSELWVAQGGRWRGYFVVAYVSALTEAKGEDLQPHFYSDSWHEVDGGPRSPFQGYTYKVPGVK